MYAISAFRSLLLSMVSSIEYQSSGWEGREIDLECELRLKDALDVENRNEII